MKDIIKKILKEEIKDNKILSFFKADVRDMVSNLLDNFDVNIIIKDMHKEIGGFFIPKNNVYINKNIIGRRDGLFLILHEIGHVLQFSKHIEDIRESIFNLDINEFKKEYLELEKDANDFALKHIWELNKTLGYAEFAWPSGNLLPDNKFLENLFYFYKNNKEKFKNFDEMIFITAGISNDNQYIKKSNKEKTTQKPLDPDLIKKSIDEILKDYDVIKGTYSNFVIKKENEKYGVLGYHHSSGKLYYDYNFWDEFFIKFSLKRFEYGDFIIKYVNMIYGWESSTAYATKSPDSMLI